MIHNPQDTSVGRTACLHQSNDNIAVFSDRAGWICIFIKTAGLPRNFAFLLMCFHLVKTCNWKMWLVNETSSNTDHVLTHKATSPHLHISCHEQAKHMCTKKLLESAVGHSKWPANGPKPPGFGWGGAWDTRDAPMTHNVYAKKCWGGYWRKTPVV